MKPAIVQAALLGTSTGGAPSFDRDLARSLDVSGERRLILAAGVEAARDRAGFVPPEAPAAVAPCPADAVPDASRKASDLLGEILGMEDSDLLVEFATRLATIGRRAPSIFVPELLAAPNRAQGRRDEVMAALRPVLGERGRWISRLAGNQWAWGARDAEVGPQPGDEVTWKEGATADRVTVLARRRGAEPSVAREWLAAVWRTERADERAAFLETFEAGLSAHDEAFLESALDDRSSAVREIAARHLAKVPSSAFARRAEERAAAMLVYTPPVPPSFWKKLRGAAPQASLDAVPPTEVPKEWERDCIAGKPPEGVGERAWRLTQALALVPPSKWCERFTSTPAELVAALAASQWRDDLLRSLAAAAVTFRDPDWAAALAAEWPFGGVGSAALGLTSIGLVGVMRPADAERLLVAHLGDSARKAVPTIYEAARAVRSWTPAFARAALAALRRDLAADQQFAYSVLKLLTETCTAWPTATVADAIALAESIPAEGADARNRDALVSRLKLRLRIHQEVVP